MNISNLTRDASKVQEILIEQKDGSVLTSKNCSILIPSRFSQRGLAEIGVDNYIIGICAIVVDNKYYSVMSVCAMLKIEPTEVLKTKINGVEYLNFVFPAGTKVISTTDLVKTDTVVYRIYDEIISKGRVPWYLNYDDLGKIFDTAKLHAGANIGLNSEVTELIISMISRDPKNKVNYYRTSITDPEYVQRHPPAYIPLRSVIYAATNTTNKLAGSYFATSVVSALVAPADRSERIELLLRK